MKLNPLGTYEIARTVDARGWLCPLPILKSESAIQEMKSGEILALKATDPGIANDLPAWCAVNGHQLISMEKSGREWLGLVKKG